MRKHRFNIFDVLVIASALTILISCLSFYHTTEEENGGIRYTLTVDPAEEHLLNSFEEGLDIFNQNGVYIGKITSVSAKTKADTALDANGKYKQIEYSGLYTATLTIDAPALSDKKNITVNGEKIAVGKTLSISTNGAVAEGICTDVEFHYYDGEEET